MEGEVVYYLMGKLSKYSSRIQHQPVKDCAGNVVAYLNGDTKESILFLAHMDTFEIFSNWKRNPWGEIEGDRLYGLGAYDAKAGLAAMVEAFITLNSMNPRPSLILAAVCDAEGFSRGAYELVKSGVLSNVKAAIVSGPTNMKVMRGAYGRFVFDVDVKGAAAIGTEEAGINAIIEAAKIILWAVKIPKLDGIGGSVAPLNVKSPELIIAHPDRCMIRLDRHYPPGQEPGVVRRKFTNLLRKTPELAAKVTVNLMKRPTPFMEPFELPEDHEWVVKVAEAVKEITGETPKLEVYRTVSDANYLYTLGNVPAVILGPRGGNHHSSDEFVELSSVYDLARSLVSLTSSELEE